MLLNLLCVGLGGFVGAILRALTGIFVSKIVLLSAFPYATLIVNVLGSFLIGMLLTSSYVLSNPNLKSFLTAGLLGGLTTFSTFSLETVALWQSQAFGLAVVNAVLSLGLCILGVIAGRFLGHMVYAS